jgi:phosphopantetheinyl transferase (holo-ACP synthase)
MYQYSVVNDTQGEDFKKVVPERFTRIRTIHWRNSRLALEDCLRRLGANPEILSSDEDIKIEQYHHLARQPDILVSIAHTRGAACAISAFKQGEVLGVGIDIEKSTREVKQDILSKFLTPEDVTNKQFLKTWCAKEAAFKSSSYFWKEQKTFVLKDITIDLDLMKFEIKNLLNGTIQFENVDGFLICLAFVTNVS